MLQEEIEKGDQVIIQYEVQGMRWAIESMRYSWGSQEKSDTTIRGGVTRIGSADLILAKKLIRGGGSHRKFLRHIKIWAELRLPRYIWTELDTYKVGTVRVSESTVHTITKKPISQDDFISSTFPSRIVELNQLISLYAQESDVSKKRDLHKKIKANLPEGFLQSSIFSANYETLIRIWIERRNHRLEEWQEICSWIESLPYMRDFLFVFDRLISKESKS